MIPMDRKKPVDTHIGQRLKEYRQHRGMTVRELADAAHVTPGQISHYEHGRDRISHERVTEFARILRIKSNDLYQPPGSRLRRNHVRLRLMNFMAAVIAEATALMSSRREAAADNEAIMVAAVAVAVSAAASDADAGERASLAISGNDTAVDTSVGSGSDSFTVNSDAALKLSPVSHSVAGTLTENETVEAINGKPAGTVSETRAFKIDTGATQQLDGSDAVNALDRTDGTNADAISLPGNHAIKAVWHASDDGRGGKTAHNAPVSGTGEDTSAQSTSADNHFTVRSPFTATPTGDGDHTASAFKPSVDHEATVDPGIHFASVPKDRLPQHPADNLSHIPAQPDHGADPTHPHVEVEQSPSFKSADDGSANPGTGLSDPPTLTAPSSDSSGTHGPAAPALAPGEDTSVQPTPSDNGYQASADPEINFASNAEHSADHSRHTPAQDDDNTSAVIGGAHAAHRQGDESESAVSKFADDGKGWPPADHGHHANADPETNFPSNAKNHPQHADDNLLHTLAQHDDNGSPVSTDGAYPGRGQGDGNEWASPKFADDGGDHPGKISHDLPALTSLRVM
jgi:transcriptional regulator with XRE-family HTH domain